MEYVSLGSLMTVSQLRSHIGNPTVDAAEVAPVFDDELQKLIDRHKKTISNSVQRRIREMRLNSQPLLDLGQYEEADITLTSSGPFAEGQIGSQFAPYTYQPAQDQNGDVYTYANNLEDHLNSFFDRRRYRIISNKVRVLPSSTSSITLSLPTKEKVTEALAADLISEANNKMIAEAREMLRSKVIEGSRLHGEQYTGIGYEGGDDDS